MKDRKGTVRQHPKGMVAVCTADFDPDYPAKARWVMSDQAHGSWHASDIYVRDWEVYFRPEWKPPLGSILTRSDEVAYKVRDGFVVVESCGDDTRVNALDNPESWTLLREGLG